MEDESRLHLMRQKARTKLAEGIERSQRRAPFQHRSCTPFRTARGRSDAGQDTEKHPTPLHSARTLLV